MSIFREIVEEIKPGAIELIKGRSLENLQTALDWLTNEEDYEVAQALKELIQEKWIMNHHIVPYAKAVGKMDVAPPYIVKCMSRDSIVKDICRI